MKTKEIMGLGIILFFLLSALGNKVISFAQNITPAQIERSQEILEEEKIIRDKLEKEEKVYIKKIIVKGVTLLSQAQIKEIISPFQKHWLTKEDIQQILDLLEKAYINNGYGNKVKGISYQIKKRVLGIQIEER